MNLFNGIYRNRKVLITGDTGFKGSWLTLWLLKLGASVTGYSKGIISSPSHFEILKSEYKTYFKDILDINSLNEVFNKQKPEIVFHLAAQSLVRESYYKPIETYNTNIIGTLNVLEAARKCETVKVFINVTTDKVYENIEELYPYKEDDSLGGYDMYSSSKACSEILTSSYRRSFLDKSFYLTSVRAGNVIGGGDWAKDRLIPDIMRATSCNKACEIRNLSSVRPWQHVLEPLSAYLLLGQKLFEGEKQYAQAWNIGSIKNETKTVKEIVQLAAKTWDKINFNDISSKAIKKHEANLLSLDCSRINVELSWKNIWDIEQSCVNTTEWYKDFYVNNIIKTEQNIQEYIKDAAEKDAVWVK